MQVDIQPAVYRLWCKHENICKCTCNLDTYVHSWLENNSYYQILSLFIVIFQQDTLRFTQVWVTFDNMDA